MLMIMELRREREEERNSNKTLWDLGLFLFSSLVEREGKETTWKATLGSCYLDLDIRVG